LFAFALLDIRHDCRRVLPWFAAYEKGRQKATPDRLSVVLHDKSK